MQSKLLAKKIVAEIDFNKFNSPLLKEKNREHMALNKRISEIEKGQHKLYIEIEELKEKAQKLQDEYDEKDKELIELVEERALKAAAPINWNEGKAAKVTASNTDKFDPKLNSGELTDKGKPAEQKDLSKMLYAQIYIMHEGRLDPVEQKYFDDKKALTDYCDEKKLEYEVLDNPHKDIQKKIDAISKKDSRSLVQSVIAIESAMGKVTATTLMAKTVMPFYRSLVNNAKHLYWQVHNIGYGQPQTKILAGSRNAHQELLKIEAMLLTMSKLAEGRATVSINNMFKDIKAIKNFMAGGLI